MDPQHTTQDRHGFPQEAVAWLLGATPRTVVVLGDPQIAEALADHGHDVSNVEGAGSRLPFPDRSVDVVVAVGRLPEDLESVAVLLRSGGQLALVCRERDQRIPWARKLDRALELPEPQAEPATGLVNSTLFGFVSDASFRHWQVVNNVTLADQVRVELHDLDDAERERRTEAALALYDEYGRGADGMQMPWLSRCFKATVVENAWAPPRGLDERPSATADDDSEAVEETAPTAETDRDGPPEGPQDGSDSDLLLIDFR